MILRRLTLATVMQNAECRIILRFCILHSALCTTCVAPMPQFIYTMKGLGKVHPPDLKVLDDIWLSFYFGAKIGVLGLNGAGKSSLLRIMAGDDRSFLGEAFAAEGISVGFLQQEPLLDSSKNVLGNVEDGVAPLKALLNR